MYTTSTPAQGHATGDREDTTCACTAQPDDPARLRNLLDEKDQALQNGQRTLSELRQEIRRLTKQLKVVQGRAEIDAPAVYADPERQFRYEVEQHWLRLIAEPDRPNHQLATYVLGPDWLESLEAIALIDRRRIIDVTVEVLTGRAASVSGRQVHRMRARSERGGMPLVRPADQAVAMRCHLRNQTAAAPRLMWWKLPDHSVELGRVAQHDDTQLR
ncbi:hypothetical protein [Streptomyces sp. NPDC054865]